ncbi:polyketide biosynthesis acyltransferase-like protein, PedC homolog [Candidatus Profftella armatura (Diaphorina cf. continua)]|uniref:Polyketide biosynthesis acyltransferase-like protein, PedC homolog n=1 Tax=Candidatus Profftella armatura (Diaphorina cf. continua) TaxID=2661583 RepID=A0A7R7ACN5_9PROT|nr:acyltransferase domain-containing protein [Candidatus Profftella armatura (Diaphorina cf. continua)]BCG49609.1 polyketide biosynthesis acyltransferase-like protein, PedC homolog [Candidatus Profftella armatura (Diaphorina cf. continua)]
MIKISKNNKEYSFNKFINTIQYKFIGDSPIVWMFSGQGSQYFNMGKTLYNKDVTFRYWMEKLDTISIKYIGQSIIKILYNNEFSKTEFFNQTLYTHPALFMFQYAMSQTLLAQDFKIPDILFGASLGEFIAAAFANITEVEESLFDIIKQAFLFEFYCNNGAMILVIDYINNSYINSIFYDKYQYELAAINFERCFVVSGLYNKITKIIKFLKEKKITYQILPVSTAFHSSHIDIIKDKFNLIFKNRIIKKSTIPIISCAYLSLNEVNNIKFFSGDYWWNIIRKPIQFSRVITDFQKKYPKAIYIDLSPSGNMGTFIKYNLCIKKRNRVIQIVDPFNKNIINIGLAKKKLKILINS